MRDFLCPNCGQHLAFENSVCLSCGALGFSPRRHGVAVTTSGVDSEHGGTVDSSLYQLCANLHVAECNWLVKVIPGRGAVADMCTSGRLTRARPNDADTAAFGRVRRRREGQAAAGSRTRDLKLPIVNRDDAGDARVTMEAIADGLEVSSGGESPSHANISRSSAPVMHAAG
jgi:hypothetical protein